MSSQVDVQPERAYLELYTDVLEQLNKKMEGTANATVVFAPPQEHDGLTVIPVTNPSEWRTEVIWPLK